LVRKTGVPRGGVVVQIRVILLNHCSGKIIRRRLPVYFIRYIRLDGEQASNALRDD
jgi:hypothetical protein